MFFSSGRGPPPPHMFPPRPPSGPLRLQNQMQRPMIDPRQHPQNLVIGPYGVPQFPRGMPPHPPMASASKHGMQPIHGITQRPPMSNPMRPQYPLSLIHI